MLTIALDCFLRPIDLRHKERRVRPCWLPIPQTAHEHVDAFEAVEQAREVFHSWVRKVRQELGTHEEIMRETAPAAP
jgi:UDP-N-acetylmuramate-alanine ligase